MGLLGIIIAAAAALSLGYWIYGRLLSKWFKLSDANLTPAHQFKNDQDFIPTDKFYLLNQHLSAIAAAGPIVGPILAGLWFGWLPTFLWIILGGIFIGGVHDLLSIVASLRHQGKSIAEVMKITMGPRAYVIFLWFLWFSIIYIIMAFTDVTASTFVEPTRGASIASASMLYLLLSMIKGVVMRRFNLDLKLATVIFLPLVFVCVWLGTVWPLHLPSVPGFSEKMTWNIFLVGYCFLAAVLPMWLLLQPRGYLGGFFLLLTAGVSLAGIVVGSFTGAFAVHAPAFISWKNSQGFPLLPILFTTVACGACSGFHCLIASGTTSRQIKHETDARVVGYGGMLLESFVAVIALGTVMILSGEQAKALGGPDQIYANGIATFLASLGINKEMALNFALLAFATFVYDTLDVTTRIGRYVLEELTGWRNRYSPYIATALTLALPLWFLTREFHDAQGQVIAGWKVFWTVFGASNQLEAALVLFGLSLWLFKQRMKFPAAFLPGLFMMAVALGSLGFIAYPWIMNMIRQGTWITDPIGLTCVALFALTSFLVWEGVKVLRSKS